VSPTILRDEPAEELPDVRAGRLPGRYDHRMQDVFLERLAPLRIPDLDVLDVGAGRAPTIAAEDRPSGWRYAGLDIDDAELAAAPPGAYDEAIVHDLTVPRPELESRFDLVLSWQVLEHVRPLDEALEGLRRVLRPGGTMIAQLSGGRSLHGVGSRVMPHRLRSRAMHRLIGAHEEEKFPTAFDRCHDRALREMLGTWSSAEVTPFYRAAPYLGFARPLQRAYLAYENAIAARDVRSLATHYLLVARR
jgi:SAM-dependent methyltransferase